jgi:tetratricopeptide (TPR) repeat protein
LTAINHFMVKKTFLFFSLLVFSQSHHAFGQKSDSLLAVLDTVQGDRKVKTLNELFRAYLQSDPVKALGFTREALNFATEIGDKKGIAASYNNLGVAYRNQGALDKALEYYINSLKGYEELDNKEGIATAKNNIANIYSLKRDYGHALRNLEESYNTFLQIGDQNKIIGSMNNLGNLHSDIQLYEKALKYFNQAYQLGEKAGKKFADPLANIGNIYFKQGNYQRAVEYYQRALEIERTDNNKLGILNVVTNLGITFTKAQQPKEAQAYLDEALALSTELQSFTSLPTVYKALAENYSKQGKMKEAYETELKYDDVREKIYGEESTRNIAQMEMVMNFQRTEREFEMLKKEDEIKTLELHNSRLFIVMMILGILIVLGSFNFFYLSKKRVFKKKL